MKTSISGYPRIGTHRELKKASEQYFRGAISSEALQQTAVQLKHSAWELQQNAGIDLIPVGDFSFYDGMLDTALLLDAIPQRYRALQLNPLDTMFAMAHGYQGPQGDVTALPMKKWFNTNYHYIVPELAEDTALCLHPERLLQEIQQATAQGLSAEQIKAVVIGPFTFLKAALYPERKSPEDFASATAAAYAELLNRLEGCDWVQLEEPALVMDLEDRDLQLLQFLYERILTAKGPHKVLLQTCFGDVRDCYQLLCQLPFDGIGLDLVEGPRNLSLLSDSGFPLDKVLFAGIVNGKNIWRNNYQKTLDILSQLPGNIQLVLNSSCSLLHVPCTTRAETKLPEQVLRHLAFAEEKLQELSELKTLAALTPEARRTAPDFVQNQALFSGDRVPEDKACREAVRALTPDSFTRKPDFAERARCQRELLQLPLFPATTIGSFPQTPDVRENRRKKHNGLISTEEYNTFNREKIRECIALQESLELDVLVHGEFERNDMVEYFGDHLEGFLFTENGWVQSYGTRCVKPPVIWGDIRRGEPITVSTSVFAQSLTRKPVKGMLTGPVTILNWSFPREDLPRRESALQIALAIREEVLDLEKNGLRIIQIDEAALREKLPLRKCDWHTEYLDWAIPAFRLVHSGVKPETQIHTHMCYSEFQDILREIDDMDADVITFEASRSSLRILQSLKDTGFRTAAGPGVYDIHSARIPSSEEILKALRTMLQFIPAEKLWVNPDCGLKTRGPVETEASLRNMVLAAKELRNEYQKSTATE